MTTASDNPPVPLDVSALLSRGLDARTRDRVMVLPALGPRASGLSTTYLTGTLTTVTLGQRRRTSS